MPKFTASDTKPEPRKRPQFSGVEKKQPQKPWEKKAAFAKNVKSKYK